MNAEIRDAWAVLQNCNKQLGIDDLCARDPGRATTFSTAVGPLYLNYARQAVDAEILAALLGLARATELEDAIAALLSGEPVNSTEDRPALHTALRATRGQAPKVQVEAANDALDHMLALVDAVHSGERRSIRQRDFDAVLSIGIGGSDLGPRLVCEALAGSRMRVRFLSNVDGDQFDAAVHGLEPERTLVVVISKSFRTPETLTNAQAARRWLTGALGCTDREAGGQMIAVTARPDRAAEMGIEEDAVLPMWDWVGGRYSVWSAVGLPVALACGSEAFTGLLQGARIVDEHFATTPLAENLPALHALLAIWNRCVMGLSSRAVVPYSSRLAALPAYLQQLEMESNGKRVTRDGEAVTVPTAPVVWGGSGTEAQHAFFQMLHQGTDRVPVDFVGVVHAAHDHEEHHRLLLANLLAQSEALAVGTPSSDAPERDHPGNRPNNVILLDDLSPPSVGALLATWEHSVFVQGWIMGVNPFDQFGVELGKRIADEVARLLDGGSVQNPDSVTQELAQKLRGSVTR